MGGFGKMGEQKLPPPIKIPAGSKWAGRKKRVQATRRFNPAPHK